MLKTICIAVFFGLVVGIVGSFLFAAPALSNIIPNGLETMIIASFAGGLAAIATDWVRKTNKTAANSPKDE